MSIEEELHASWGKHAIEDGIEAGELYTKEQYEEAKEQYEEAKEQYEEAKEQYEEAKEQYEEMKEQYEEAKEQYEEMKEQRISEIYQIALKLTQNGILIDEVIDDYIPADIRAEVRQRFSEE